MNLAYVHNLAKDDNGVKYLLVRRGLFDRTVDAKEMKTKDSKETARAISTMITKEVPPKKTLVAERTEFAVQFEKICKAEGIESYSTRDETKAAFSERTIRSLKIRVYRYMEDYGYKYIHKRTQFVTILTSRRNFLKDLTPKNAKNSNFLSILYT